MGIGSLVKKILWVLSTIIFLAAAAVVVLILTFDADRFRPMLAKEAEKALGRPVEIGHVSLMFSRGLALGIRGLKIYESVSEKEEPILDLESAAVSVNLSSLFQKQIQVSSILYKKPRIRLSKIKNAFLEAAPAQAKAGPVPGGPKEGNPVSFLLDLVRVEDGELWFDSFKISGIDAEIKNFSFSKPFMFQLRMAAFGGEQDFFVSGRADLAQASLELNDGNVSFERFAPSLGLEKLHAELSFKDDTIQVRDISGRLAEGQIQLSGVVSQPMAQARSDFKLVFQDLSIGAVTKQSAGEGRPALQGRLTLAASGTAVGTRWEQISQTLNGRGRAQINDGVILNYNALAAILQKLSKIPGVGDSILSGVPPAFQRTLSQPNTNLQPVDFFVNIHDGRMDFDRLTVATDAFEIAASGTIGLDSQVGARATLWMHPQLSSALVQSVPPVQLVTDSYGLIEIPLIIGGKLPHLSVKPDMDYLTSKIVSAKAGELVTSLLSKGSEGGVKSSSDLLKGLLGKAFRKGES